ncbi:MAG TPA: hypothetical protein P5080_05610 [Candidatus Paceibacterota bacterium]|nr:hypothetical protein [Candidatus Pacearchaeota archaeon]HRZ51423.1 hypothetical protein [Candidatus Paceibacterota bacterium]HSA37145.1 hypothetical protein [Candidatus Paceibacterota bacterium]
MEPKKAIVVLTSLLDKKNLDAEDKEAVLAAIGALDSANLAENRMKRMIKAKKTKRDKAFEL